MTSPLNPFLIPGGGLSPSTAGPQTATAIVAAHVTAATTPTIAVTITASAAAQTTAANVAGVTAGPVTVAANVAAGVTAALTAIATNRSVEAPSVEPPRVWAGFGAGSWDDEDEGEGEPEEPPAPEPAPTLPPQPQPVKKKPIAPAQAPITAAIAEDRRSHQRPSRLRKAAVGYTATKLVADTLGPYLGKYGRPIAAGGAFGLSWWATNTFEFLERRKTRIRAASAVALLETLLRR